MRQEFRTIHKFLFSLLVFLLMFLITEGVIRIFKVPLFQRPVLFGWSKDDFFSLHQKDTRFGSEILKPNVELYHKHDFGEYAYTIKTGELDGLGFRLNSTSTNAPSDDKKPIIWNFGDSFTFGFGVEGNDTYSGILASRGFTSFNFGVSCFSLSQEIELFNYHYKQAATKPDIVSFAVFWGNDIPENQLSPSLRTVDAHYTESEFSHLALTKIIGKLEGFLYERSLFYGFFSDRSLQLARKILHRPINVQYDFETPKGYFINPNYLTNFDLRFLSWAQVDGFLSAICDFPFDDYQADFYFLLFPSKEMIFEAESYPERKAEINRIAELLKLRCQKKRVVIIDYFDSANHLWFFPKDTHFNEYGHQTVAEELMKNLGHY